MRDSRPSVHPIEAPPSQTNGAAENPMPRGRLKDIQGMPGTPGGLVLRLFQFSFAVVSLAVMASTSDFPSVTAFCYLVAATGLQSIWSLSLAIVDIYAILVKRSLRNFRIVSVFAIGDGIISTLVFAAACASAVALAVSSAIMASNRGQNGIQQLLAAEQEAQHIVNAARTAKVARLKQAKEEADKDIAEFRAQVEANFQQKLAESSGDSGANVKRLEHETQAKIQYVKTQAASISHDVVHMLLKHVTTVKK